MSTAEPPRPPFDWTIDEARTWPPARRPRPPYGPTTIEIARSCPLRACFEASPGYEPRLDPAARIGTAFHRTLEALLHDPPADATPAGWGDAARRRFLAELAQQRAEAVARPRERGLPWEEARVYAALEAVVAEAMRLARLRPAAGQRLQQGAPGSAAAAPAIEVEVPVRSRDGRLHGWIDQAEHTATGTRLIDLKSALRSDLPERYERQLQLYAALWHDTRGEWPAEAVVIYPFTGARFPVSVDPAVCRRVVAEARELVRQFESPRAAEALATPPRSVRCASSGPGAAHSGSGRCRWRHCQERSAARCWAGKGRCTASRGPIGFGGWLCAGEA